ncbi:MAG: helix-turn-helix transcriptional regulator, partial [Acidiferrobacterales bacterium]
MDRLLDVSALAEILGVTPNAVRCRLAQGSQDIPPPVRLPGSSGIRWRQSDVEAWLAALPVRATEKPALRIPAKAVRQSGDDGHPRSAATQAGGLFTRLTAMGQGGGGLS